MSSHSYGLVVELGRNVGVPAHQEWGKSKQLQFFRTFFGAAEKSQVVKLAPRGRLLEAQRISQECKMRFTEKCRHDASYQRDQQPWRVNEYPRRQADRRNGLLYQPAGNLDHLHAVGALHSRAFQLVVEDRVFI